MFDRYLIGLGLAPKTVTVYHRVVQRAIDRCHELGISLDHIEAEQLAELAASFPASPSSRRQLRTALQYWYEWRGLPRPALRAIRVPKAKRGKFNGLEHDEARMLAKTCLGWYPEGLAVLAGLYMALRREEIATMRWDRFDPQLEWYTVHGKGDTIADVPVHPTLRRELRPNFYVWVFPGRQGGHVTPATVWNWTKAAAKRAGIRDIHPHQLRHTAIATVNDNTGDLRAAQSFARHARPETTAIYTRTTAERLQEAVATLDYLD
jgi:integrase/recombinase XerC